MTKRRKILISSILIIAVILVGGFFIISLINKDKSTNTPKKEIQQYTPEGEVSQTDDKPQVVDSSDSNNNQNINNSDVSKQLEPSDDMKKIISDNKNDLNNSDVIDQITESYPSNVIPLYKAKSAADSNDIITQNGNPGWTAQYGSDATVPDITAFYQKLLESSSNYKTSTNADTNTITGTVNDCSVSITVTPNNPERTGLNDQSNVDIFIERN